MYATQLRTSQLGNTGLEITRVGFGGWAIGGGWEFGWGPQQDDESIAAIHRAVDLGINWIDTAAAYGFGRSERVVGLALAGLRERPLVFTKASLLDDGTGHVRHSLKRDSILREAEASLRRLGIDAIDLYQIHWPVPEQDIEEGWAAMAELKEQGLVRHIGVSNFDAAQLRRIVYSPMGSGLLTGAMTRERIAQMPADDWRASDPRFTEPQLSEHLALAARLQAVADRHAVTPGAVAVAWTLLNPAVDGAITGFRGPGQVDPIVAATDLELTDADVTEIEAGK
jgi:aryl-alcohol dehydrogenase-like predicted oxidoreductase